MDLFIVHGNVKNEGKGRGGRGKIHKKNIALKIGKKKLIIYRALFTPQAVSFSIAHHSQEDL